MQLIHHLQIHPPLQIGIDDYHHGDDKIVDGFSSGECNSPIDKPVNNVLRGH